MKRAEDGTRTRYLQLGKLSLYQVSYFRFGMVKVKTFSKPHAGFMRLPFTIGVLYFFCSIVLHLLADEVANNGTDRSCDGEYNIVVARGEEGNQ
jgi:hypothetical protein